MDYLRHSVKLLLCGREMGLQRKPGKGWWCCMFWIITTYVYIYNTYIYIYLYSTSLGEAVPCRYDPLYAWQLWTSSATFPGHAPALKQGWQQVRSPAKLWWSKKPRIGVSQVTVHRNQMKLVYWLYDLCPLRRRAVKRCKECDIRSTQQIQQMKCCFTIIYSRTDSIGNGKGP